MSHPLLVSAIPYLQDTYYFNKGEKIVFKVTITYNTSIASGVNITNVQVNVSSPWLNIQSGKKIEFDSVDDAGLPTKYIFSKAALKSSESFYGNITCKVKDTIQPLSALYILLNARGSYDGKDVIIDGEKSNPVVYGVFPEVNLTRAHDSGKFKAIRENVIITKVFHPEFSTWCLSVDIGVIEGIIYNRNFPKLLNTFFI